MGKLTIRGFVLAMAIERQKKKRLLPCLEMLNQEWIHYLLLDVHWMI